MSKYRNFFRLFTGLLVLILAACAAPLPDTGAEQTRTAPETQGPAATPGLTPGPGAEDNLANTQWRLVSFGEPGAEMPVIQATEITLEFEAGGQAVGSGGCNSYGAQYEVLGGALSFDQIIQTEIACTGEGVMEQEQAYFQALQAAGEFELTDGELKIRYDEGQGVLNFTRALSGTATALPGGQDNLVNTRWLLESFGPAGAEQPLVVGSTITLEFEADGQAGGDGGCNSYGGRYEVQDRTLTIEEIVSTLRACADQRVTDQEQAYLQALQSAGEFELTDDQLKIWYDDGQGVLNFTRAPA